MHDLYLEVIIVQNNKLCLFWAKTFSLLLLLITSDIAAEGATFKVFYYRARFGIRPNHNIRIKLIVELKKILLLMVLINLNKNKSTSITNICSQ